MGYYTPFSPLIMRILPATVHHLFIKMCLLSSVQKDIKKDNKLNVTVLFLDILGIRKKILYENHVFFKIYRKIVIWLEFSSSANNLTVFSQTP